MQSTNAYQRAVALLLPTGAMYTLLFMFSCSSAVTTMPVIVPSMDGQAAVNVEQLELDSQQNESNLQTVQLEADS